MWHHNNIIYIYIYLEMLLHTIHLTSIIALNVMFILSAENQIHEIEEEFCDI